MFKTLLFLLSLGCGSLLMSCEPPPTVDSQKPIHKGYQDFFAPDIGINRDTTQGAEDILFPSLAQENGDSLSLTFAEEPSGVSEQALEITKTIPGTPTPKDTYQPPIPDGGVVNDIAVLFAEARKATLTSRAYNKEPAEAGQVVVLTPERLFWIATRGEWKRDLSIAAELKPLLGSDSSLNIAVVSYTKLPEIAQDPTTALLSAGKYIPFMGYLLDFARAGHSVVVFEGHTSAFESGVRNTDVLIVDSAMIPFLQDGWAKVAFKAMQKDARIIIHDRESDFFLPIAPAKSSSGWQYSEFDGEASYVNALLTTMANAPKQTVKIVAGEPLPDLAKIAVAPDDLQWVKGLPFKYEQLDAEKVIEIVMEQVQPNLLGILSSSKTLRAKLAISANELRDVSFELTEGRSTDDKRRLDITLK